MSSKGSSANVDWWMWELAGLVTLAVGIIVLLEPGKSLEALTVITGIYLLLDAIMAFVSALRHDGDHEMPVIHGVVSLVIGLILVRHPLDSVAAIAIFIGIWLLTIGCIGAIAALRQPNHVALRFVIALVAAIAGAVIIAQPHIGYNTLAIIAGISLALQGLGLLVLGWNLRHVQNDEQAEPVLSPATP